MNCDVLLYIGLKNNGSTKKWGLVSLILVKSSLNIMTSKLD